MSVCRWRALTYLPTQPHKHTGPSYKPYCMPSLTVALLLLEWLHDGVYAGRCVHVCSGVRARTLTITHTYTYMNRGARSYLTQYQ